MEPCISENTPDAPTNNIITPMVVKNVLLVESFTFLIVSCICSAAALPTSPFICPKFRLSQLQRRKKNPHKLIMIMSNGGNKRKWYNTTMLRLAS